METTTIEIIANKEERIDKLISTLTQIPRSQVVELIKQKQIFVEGALVRKAHFLTKIGNKIEITNKVIQKNPIEAQPIDLEIIYEDEDLIIINKASNLVVHPAPGNKENTLVNGLVYHCKNLSDTNGELRPGIIHRLDKKTSGLMIVAKTNKAHRLLALQIQKREIIREYLAICVGKLKNDKIQIDLPIGRDPTNRTKMSVRATKSKEALTFV